MTPLVAAALDTWQLVLAGAGLVFLRVGAVMALLPAFGERSIPIRVRLALALAFAAVIAPAALPGYAGIGPGAASLAAAALAEIVAGLALGIVLRLMVLVLQIAGTIAANVTSLSQILGGASADPQPAMAHVMVVAGLALATMAGLHVKAVQAMLLSYELFPPGRPIAPGILAEWGVGRVARSFALAFTLSAPFVIASVLYNLALGAINRAMPQLMVAFVGAPAITFAGLTLMLLALPALLGLWQVSLDQLLSAPGGP